MSLDPHSSEWLTRLDGLYGIGRTFRPGQIVRHKHHGYRGLIVAVDEVCHAPEHWYVANATQPTRDQPWYHVLVHRSRRVTYAAHENLQPDTSGEPIVHPLMPMFFGGFEDGGYVRNAEPWKGWDV